MPSGRDLCLAFLQKEFETGLERTGREQRPYVTLSFAQSLDGGLAAERHQRSAISSADGLEVTHFIRSRHDAILVGAGTVQADDPLLTIRQGFSGRNRAIVLDSQLKLGLDYRLYQQRANDLLVICAQGACPLKQKALQERGIEIVAVPHNAQLLLDIHAVLKALHRRGLRSIMVEGGARVLASFLAEGEVDLLALTIAPQFFGTRQQVAYAWQDAPKPPLHIRRPQYFQVGDDLVLCARGPKAL